VKLLHEPRRRAGSIRSTVNRDPCGRHDPGPHGSHGADRVAASRQHPQSSRGHRGKDRRRQHAAALALRGGERFQVPAGADGEAAAAAK
jgi:hypothetical protein